MSLLPNWPIFVGIPSAFQKKVTHVCVFGERGDELLVVVGQGDKSCEVYRTKVGDPVATISVTQTTVSLVGAFDRISDICVTAEQTFLLLTTKGDVYAWGCNISGQIGNAETGNIVQEPFLVSQQPGLKGDPGIQIAVGKNHCVCLVSSGRVFSWGSNACKQLGHNSEANLIAMPTAVSHSALKERKVIQIACSQLATFALDDSGALFGWGSNGGARLLGSSDWSATFTRIGGDFLNQHLRVTEIVCGSDHVLALSESGALYAWGGNARGQLGLGHSSDAIVPTRIPAFERPRIRIKSILAFNQKSMSLALSTTGAIYVWGHTRFSSACSSPRKFPGKCLKRIFCDAEVFPLLTPDLLEVENVQLIGEGNVVPSWLRMAFDNPETCDLKLVVQGRSIHVHKAFLKARSPYFRAMFSSDDGWRETQSDAIEIAAHPYASFRALLYYLYTGEVDIPDEMAQEDVFTLMTLANYYLEDDLKIRVSEFFLARWLSIDNVLDLYMLAVENSLPEVASACLELILENLSVLATSESFCRLNPAHVRDIFLKAAERCLLKT